MLQMVFKNSHGFTLIETVVVILVIGILTGMAVVKLSPSIEKSNYEATMAEMAALSEAIAGNPILYANGARTDFGYVGDIGAMPPNLDALVQNPGGYAAWDGPYIGRGAGVDDYKKDAWGTEYLYIDTIIRSTGSGTNIDRLIVPFSGSLLSNSIIGLLRDASGDRPTDRYNDSILINLNYPNGSGGRANNTINPNPGGEFVFNNIPVGNHNLSMIYIPDSDTVSYEVTVYPGRNASLDIIFPADLW
jgi:general secretion pathway protein G